ncbi:MAG TPA: hypothetical protein VNA27_03725 [Rubrobacteraceae bacterium]|nr:hypothetical protein [Rubrobacteraceae bacterium]
MNSGKTGRGWAACALYGTRESDWGAGEMISSPVLTPEGVQATTESHVPIVRLIRINCSYVTGYAAAPMDFRRGAFFIPIRAGRAVLQALLLALIDMPYSVYGRFVGV